MEAESNQVVIIGFEAVKRDRVVRSQWSKETKAGMFFLTAPVLLGLSTIVSAWLHSDCLSAGRLDDVVGRLQRLVRYDAVDFCSRSNRIYSTGQSAGGR